MAEPLSRLGEIGQLDPATQAYLALLARQQASNMSVQSGSPLAMPTAAGPYDPYNQARSGDANVSAPPDPREGGISIRPMPDVGEPMVSPGPQVSAGMPWANKIADEWFAARPRAEQPQDTLYKTSSPLVNITQADIDRASELGMAFSGGGLGIKAYHGSPYDFEKFDISKVGTGEGAQAYGHGLYFAENEGVAKSYRDAMAGLNVGGKHLPTGDADYLFMDAARKAAPIDQKTADFISTNITESLKGGHDLGQMRSALLTQRGNDPVFAKALDAALSEASTATNLPGHMYEVNINADPAHFLNWDQPLGGQSEHVRQALEQSRLAPKSVDLGSFAGQPIQTAPRWAGTPEQSAALREAGIPGIRYLDQGSRNAPSRIAAQQRHIAYLEGSGASDERLTAAKQHLESLQGQGSSNYVVFNPDIIDIMRKYAAAGIALPPAVAAAFQQQQRQ